MIILEIEPGIDPFRKKKFKFMPGVNFLRGANGIGKTLILEYASLLGHVAVLPVRQTKATNVIKMRVKLSKSDRAFFDALEASELQTDDPPPVNDPKPFFENNLANFGLTVSDVVAAWVSYRGAQKSAINLKFWFVDKNHERLKEMLGNEELLIAAGRVAGDIDQINLVKALNLWSRPVAATRVEGTEASTTPGFLPTPRLVNRLAPTLPFGNVPGVTFYVNTDMYDFGIGLDVRESPKHLKKNLSEIMIERLQMVSCDVDNLSSSARTSTAITADDEHYLICDAELSDDDSDKDNPRAWSRVFEDKDHNFKEGWVTRKADVSATAPIDEQFEWRFSVGRREGFHEFVSSGENQALFVLAMLHGLTSPGSCMIFDEPELHLTFGAGSLLIREICKRAKDTQSQVIIVTHMPHLYRQHVQKHPDSPDDVSDDEYDYASYRMIYLNHKDRQFTVDYDLEAVNLAAKASHSDIRELIDGMKLDEVGIRPSWASWPSAEEWFSELWRAILASDG